MDIDEPKHETDVLKQLEERHRKFRQLMQTNGDDEHGEDLPKGEKVEAETLDGPTSRSCDMPDVIRSAILPQSSDIDDTTTTTSPTVVMPSISEASKVPMESQHLPEEMEWEPIIPPTLTEDLIYDVIKLRLATDLHEMRNKPRPNTPFRLLPTNYHKSVNALSLVSRRVHKHVHKVVDQHHDVTLEERRTYYAQYELVKHKSPGWIQLVSLPVIPPTASFQLVRTWYRKQCSDYEKKLEKMDKVLDMLETIQKALERVEHVDREAKMDPVGSLLRARLKLQGESGALEVFRSK